MMQVLRSVLSGFCQPGCPMFGSRWNNDAVTVPVNFNTVGNREQMMIARANECPPHVGNTFDSNYVGCRCRAPRHYRYLVFGMKSCHIQLPPILGSVLIWSAL